MLGVFCLGSLGWASSREIIAGFVVFVWMGYGWKISGNSFYTNLGFCKKETRTQVSLRN